MKRALTKAQMKCCDEYTSEYFGVPSEILMERAALAVFDEIRRESESASEAASESTSGTVLERTSGTAHDRRILILCGTGNNGADGLALCRILRENGCAADYIVPEDGGRHSRLFDFQKEILEKYGVSENGQNDTDIRNGMFNSELYEKYDVIVDALFGIGLNREVSETVSGVLDVVNNIPSGKVLKIAVDISSGINADNGQILGKAFAADVTVTFGFAKIGQLIYPGKKYTGRLVCASVGITEKSLRALKNGNSNGAFTIEQNDKTVFHPSESDVAALYPKRPEDGNKGTFGKVLIYAGCETMSGAAIMSAKAAFRAGCGMVRVITVPENRPALQTAVPEAMLTIAEGTKGLDYNENHRALSIESRAGILEAIGWCDVILAGPGIGKSSLAGEILELLINNSENRKIVLDADALNIISENDKLRELVRRRENDGCCVEGIKPRKSGSSKYVLTPHIGELSRLTGMKIADIKADFVKNVMAAAEKLGCILIAKDAVSIVTDGEKAYICDFGNNGMATAGSGDVLAGITASEVAYFGNIAGGANSGSIAKCGAAKESDTVLNAALVSTCIHGKAGNECLSSLTPENIMAGDIIEALPAAIKKWEK